MVSLFFGHLVSWFHYSLGTKFHGFHYSKGTKFHGFHYSKGTKFHGFIILRALSFMVFMRSMIKNIIKNIISPPGKKSDISRCVKLNQKCPLKRILSKTTKCKLYTHQNKWFHNMQIVLESVYWSLVGKTGVRRGWGGGDKRVT